MKSNLEILKMDNHTWVISEGTGRGRTHCYLLEGDDLAVIIDTGLNVIDIKGITQSITSKNVHVINTHGHFDHISNNHQFNKVYMHPKDKPVFLDHSSYETRYKFFTARYKDKGWLKWLIYFPFIYNNLKKQCNIPKQHDYFPVYDGMTIDLGKRELKIIETPGHTLGSICILDVGARRLYTGDTLCEDAVLLHFDHSASVNTFLESLQKLKDMSNFYDKIYAGHQKIPLEIDLLNDYIGCANMILEGKAEPIKSSSAVGVGYRAAYKRATISYIPTN